MSKNYPAALVPVMITDAMLSASSIAEPAASETLWVSGTTYAVGDLRIRTQTHREYKRTTAGAGTLAPELDTTNWTDNGPTLKWAAYDTETDTQSTATTTLSFTLVPGFFNTVWLGGLNAEGIDLIVKDAPGGSVIKSYSGSLQRPPLDWYDWAFGQIVQADKFILGDIVPYPNAELTVTLTAAAGVTVGVGMVAVGDLRPLLGDVDWGGTEYGASAEPVDFSYIKTDEFGKTAIKRRRSATDMRISVKMKLESADVALATVQELRGVPAVFIATDAVYCSGLSVFGLGSGKLIYDTPKSATLSYYVKGLL